MKKIVDKINQLLKKEPFLFKDNLNVETEIRSLPKWDSLKHLMFLMEVEKAFNIEIAPEEIASLKTIDNLIKKVKDDSPKA